MRHVDFDPATLAGDDKLWWEDWTTRARAATMKLIEAYETWKIGQAGKANAGNGTADKVNGQEELTLSFKAAIWTELKLRLLDKLFEKKCAYCETGKSVGWPVEVEHLRPKGAVEFRGQNETKMTLATFLDEGGAAYQHPGYFWLAYNWKNLLPCCKRCNSGKGKNKQFPVGRRHSFVKRLSAAEVNSLKGEAIPSPRWAGAYYLGPEDLDESEDRLLLNPYYDEPSLHIVYGVCGIEAAKSPRGEQTIQVFYLSDDDLRRARQRAQDDAYFDVVERANHFRKNGASFDDAFELARKEFQQSRAGMEYSMAVLDALDAQFRRVARPAS